MAVNQRWQVIPTQLEVRQFEEFVLPHLSIGRRGPIPKLSLHKIFNYVLRLLYLGCQWKELPIEKDGKGRPEIHHTRIYRIWRRWESDGCINAIFIGSVFKLHQDNRLDISIVHGDGTTTAAKKGGDNIGFSGRVIVNSGVWPSWKLGGNLLLVRISLVRGNHYSILELNPVNDIGNTFKSSNSMPTFLSSQGHLKH